MVDTVIYETEWVKIGQFEINKLDPNFARPGEITDPLVVFPKRSIWIQHEGFSPFVSDHTHVNLYNRDQIYSRYAIHPDGDLCHWFCLNDEWLNEVVGSDTVHFQQQQAHCDANTYLQHLAILHEIELGGVVDEAVLNMLTTIAGASDEVVFNRQKERHQALVSAVKESIQSDLSVNLSLQSLARLHHTSAFHLSRVFKRVTGMGINQYRQQQRLRQMSWLLKQGVDNLTELALDLGFSSHAHMSASFKAAFGCSPSNWLTKQSITH